MKESPEIIPRLREAFAYDPETGEVTYRRSRQGRNRGVGQRAGALNPMLKRRYLGFNKCLFLEHRVIFALVEGRWPTHEIDHKNNIPSDNRWENLREATKTQNKANSVYRNKSGLKGAYFNKSTNRWLSFISRRGKQVYLGSFGTPEEAHEAYKAAATGLHGEFARFDRAYLD